MRKNRENCPYKVSINIEDGIESITVSFLDGQKKKQKALVDREVFVEMHKQRLDENRQVYAIERYVSHFIGDQSDEEINSIAFYPLPNVEDAILNKELSEVIVDAILLLTESQRRRFVLRHICGKSFREIAQIEQCTHQSAHESVTAAEKILKEKLKKYFVEP